MYALRRNPKAQQLADDFDPNTVDVDIEELKRVHHYLIEKAYSWPEGPYLSAERAEEQIEQMKNANQELLNRVSEITILVKDAVAKIKQEQSIRRQKQREQVIKNFNGDNEDEDPSTKELFTEKKKLYKELKEIKSEIFNLRIKFQNIGGIEKLTGLKDEYKILVEQNYELLEEVKLLQRNKNLRSKAEEKDKESINDFEDRISLVKSKIEAEKKRFLYLAEKSKDLDSQLQK